MAEPKRRPGRPATGVTPMRSFRMGAIYDQAAEIANQRGEKLKDVIERKLQEYISEGDEMTSAIYEQRSAELGETMTAAGWTVEHRYADPDSAWAGGVFASKDDVAVSIVRDTQHGGYIASPSGGSNDYTGSDPVALAESFR